MARIELLVRTRHLLLLLRRISKLRVSVLPAACCSLWWVLRTYLREHTSAGSSIFFKARKDSCTIDNSSQASVTAAAPPIHNPRADPACCPLLAARTEKEKPYVPLRAHMRHQAQCRSLAMGNSSKISLACAHGILLSLLAIDKVVAMAFSPLRGLSDALNGTSIPPLYTALAQGRRQAQRGEPVKSTSTLEVMVPLSTEPMSLKSSLS